MARSDLADGLVHVIQQKTGAELYVPIAPELDAAMKACPAKGLSLIGDANGRPLKRDALSHLMRVAIRGPGCRRVVCHTGCVRPLCAAWRKKTRPPSRSRRYPAKTLKEVERYTKAADQKKLARAAMDKLGARSEHRVPNGNGKSA